MQWKITSPLKQLDNVLMLLNGYFKTTSYRAKGVFFTPKGRGTISFANDCFARSVRLMWDNKMEEETSNDFSLHFFLKHIKQCLLPLWGGDPVSEGDVEQLQTFYLPEG